MFGVKHNECVGFESRWEVKKVYYEGSSQTPLYVSKNVSTETNKKQEVETQTDAHEVLKNIKIDEEKLAKFLTKIYPKVHSELDNASSSTAFRGYNLLGDTSETTSKLLQTVEVIPQNEKADIINFVKLSCITWNCSAKTIAIALSYQHESWCYDPGQILIYALNRDDKIPEAATRKIGCDSCVTNIKFHPITPALLAGSTHGGTIIIWNVQNKEDDTVLMKISRNDNVSHLDWMCLDHVTLDIVFLVTASLDGILTMWRFNGTHTCANVYERYKIKGPLLGKTMNKQKKLAINNTALGITCFDFSKHLPDMFIVGTEGGLVVQCSTSKPTKLKGDTENDPLYDPVFQYYQPHEGGVTSVSLSKERKDVFLTSGLDMQTRIYVIGQEDPARVLFASGRGNILDWVPHQKHLIFGYGTGGCIEVHDITSGKIVNTEEDNAGNVERKDVRDCDAVCCLNPKKMNVVVVGLKKGVLELWSVPWSSYGNT